MARILIVDDDEGVRSFLAEALQTGSHQITEAASSEEAMRCLRAQRFHLLITDLRMPGQGGLALLRQARAGWPQMGTMVLTAFSSSQAAAEAMRLGASDLLHKPLPSPDALRRRVGLTLNE